MNNFTTNTYQMKRDIVNFSKKISNAIKEKVPGWTVGKPVSQDILDEIFSDETLFNSEINGSNTRKNQFDTFI